MRYEQIKSAAHRYAHSFVSSVNWIGDDYVMGYLARAAVETGEPELRVDLLTGEAGPPGMLTPPVRSSLEWYLPWFSNLLPRRGVQPGAIREAKMCIRFDFSRITTPPTVPFECEVEVTDDRGIVHVAAVRESALIRDLTSTGDPTPPEGGISS